MLISEKKVELILKQEKRVAWERLCYDMDSDAEGAFLAEDENDEDAVY